MKHHFKRRRIIMIRIIFQQRDLTDIRQILFLITFTCDDIKHTSLKTSSIYYVFSGGIREICLLQTEINIIRQIIVLKNTLLLEQILREEHLCNNALADLIRRNLIFLQRLPQHLHITRGAAIIIRKIHQRHFIKLLLPEQLKTQVIQERIFFIVIVPDLSAAQTEYFFFIVCINSLFLKPLECRTLFFVLLLPYSGRRSIFPAKFYKTRFIKEPPGLIHNRVRIMASFHGLPHNSGLLIVQADHRAFFTVIRNPLPDLSILFIILIRNKCITMDARTQGFTFPFPPVKSLDLPDLWILPIQE